MRTSMVTAATCTICRTTFRGPGAEQQARFCEAQGRPLSYEHQVGATIGPATITALIVSRVGGKHVPAYLVEWP